MYSSAAEFGSPLHSSAWEGICCFLLFFSLVDLDFHRAINEYDYEVCHRAYTLVGAMLIWCRTITVDETKTTSLFTATGTPPVTKTTSM